MENNSWNVEGALPGAEFAEESEFTRLFGFYRPQRMMRDIVMRPSCITPLVLASLVAMAYMVVVRPQLAWTRNDAVLATAGVAAALLIRVLLMAGALSAFAAAVSHAPVSFRQVFAVVCYARMPGVVFTVLAILLIMLRRASGLPDGHPINPMLTNLAVFLDPRTTSRFVYFLASSVDCVVFWQLSLMALGLKAASRLSSAAANFGVVAMWAVFALAQAAWVQFGLR